MKQLTKNKHKTVFVNLTSENYFEKRTVVSDSSNLNLHNNTTYLYRHLNIEFKLV